MPVRFLAALGAALAAAGLAAALGAGPLLLALAAALGAAGGQALAEGPAPAPLAPPRETPLPPRAAEPAPGLLIEAFDEPVLLVERQRVVRANAAARAALGQHIVEEDVRVAIRHPAAAERLIGRGGDAGDDTGGGPIELVGVGTPERRWALIVHPLDDERRLVRLVDRTGTHAAERTRVDFVANASHELRTPLATLLGFIETLEEGGAGDDAPTRARFLRIMFGEAKRMQRLVDDLISLSRIEADRYSQPQERVDLRDVIAEVRDATVSGLGADAGRVVVAIDDDAPPVAGDAAQLSQLLHNLIGNALKYGRAQAPVTVTLRAAQGMVRLSVADEGEGIAPEHLPRITERFYRVDPGRSRALGGTGLGLAIVKHIVERHRGRLDIASEPGRGTIVTVLLPPAPAGLRAPPPTAGAGAGAGA